MCQNRFRHRIEYFSICFMTTRSLNTHTHFSSICEIKKKSNVAAVATPAIAFVVVAVPYSSPMRAPKNIFGADLRLCLFIFTLGVNKYLLINEQYNFTLFVYFIFLFSKH